MLAGDEACGACGADRILKREVQVRDLVGLNKARRWILWIGIWYMVSGLLMIAVVGHQMTGAGKVALLGIHASLLLIHLGLYVWAARAPLAAAVVALLLFLVLQLGNAVFDPSTLAKGIAIKILFLAVLVKAIRAGAEIQRQWSGNSGPSNG